MRQVVLYDFDGTIYKRDSFITFVFFAIPPWRIIVSVFYLFPIIVRVLFDFSDNHDSKQKIFSYFFKGMNIDFFNSICSMYKSKLSADVFDCLNNHIQEHSCFKQVIVSASVTNWILPFAAEIGVNDVIGTEIEIDAFGRITGIFSTKNCNKYEKVNRIREYFANEEVCYYVAIGNSKSDFPMLMLAENGFLVKSGKLVRVK
jgi:phosphatidylglycerophosphatase C